MRRFDLDSIAYSWVAKEYTIHDVTAPGEQRLCKAYVEGFLAGRDASVELLKAQESKYRSGSTKFAISYNYVCSWIVNEIKK